MTVQLIIDHRCPCGHLWKQHDPEDGNCEAYPAGDHCDPLIAVAAISTAHLLDDAERRGEQ